MNNNSVKLDIDADGVATVTLNRPQVRNAFDEALIAALTDTFKTLAGEAQMRVLVLRAEGKHFCAGADIGWMRRMAGSSRQENIKDAGALAAMLYALDTLPVPTIARVQGAARGGGVGLICCCDMAIAAEDATFAFSEVKLGLIPSTIAPYALRAIGAHAARRFFLTAETFTARQALGTGMVSEVVAEPALDARLAELIQALLANGPAALRAAKGAIQKLEGRPIDQALLQETSEGIAAIRATAEAQEGLSAFLDKRPPAWVKQP